MNIKCAKCSTWQNAVYHDGIQAVRECQMGNAPTAADGTAQEAVRDQVAPEPRPAPSQAGRVDLSHLEALVPEGRYAVTLDGESKLRFFKVDKPTEGKWKGYTFVKEQASDDLFPVKSPTRREVILRCIGKDVHAALVTYGRELGKCGVCGRTLTDEDSRANGIGPVCAQNL